MESRVRTAGNTAEAHLLAICTATQETIAPSLVPYCCLRATYDYHIDGKAMLRPISMPESSVFGQIRLSWRVTMQRLPIEVCDTPPSHPQLLLLVGT
jgi:hypothetical protein